jgi:dolichol-phosphate mannosyltransferase
MLMDILVIVPTYNEKANLPRLLDQLLAHESYGVLVVDDMSPDGTGDIAEDFKSRYPGRVDVLHRSGPRGLGNAYREGIAHALTTPAPVICQMDADLSHDPVYLPDLVEAARSHDLVIGSRYLNGISVVNWPLQRLALSTAANGYIRTVTRVPVRDCTSGFRCWRRDALATVHRRNVSSNGYAFIVEMLVAAHYAGLRIGEVPIVFVERREGVSKLSTPVLAESLVAPWRALVRERFARH